MDTKLTVAENALVRLSAHGRSSVPAPRRESSTGSAKVDEKKSGYRRSRLRWSPCRRTDNSNNHEGLLVQRIETVRAATHQHVP